MVYFEKSRSFVNRHGWTFIHEGKELAGLANSLHRRFRECELEARNRAADLLRDPQIHHEDKRVIAAKDDIIKYGKLREQCAVWTYEFERNPDREFSLGINDVSFFGIFHPYDDTPYEAATQRTGWKFSYKGSDLTPALMQKVADLENEKRAMKVDEDKSEIEEEQAENSLLAEEFEKNPDKNVQLALGDVVYLDLAPLLKRTEEE